MSDEFGQLLSEQKEVAISQGAVVSGQVIAVKEDEIVLNIGYKADAVISRNEFTNIPNANLCDLVKVGDEIEAKVVKMNDGEGQVQLSVRKLQAERGSKVLEDAFENKTVLKAVVTEISTGGLSVVVDQTRVFIPASLVSDVYEKNLEKYKGQEVEFIVTEFNPKKHRIIGNCKELIIEKKKKMQEELFAKLEVGQTVEGTVKNVTDFGAFVDLGGADGLLHVSQISRERVEKPQDVLSIGQEITAKVVDLNVDAKKISLSMKALANDEDQE